MTTIPRSALEQRRDWLDSEIAATAAAMKTTLRELGVRDSLTPAEQQAYLEALEALANNTYAPASG
jgi:hypothetical protein